MVDLKSAQAVILPEGDRSLDPLRIPKAIEDAGFSPGRMEVMAVGTLTEREDRLHLEIPGLHTLELQRGGKAIELMERKDLQGGRARITGELHLPQEGKGAVLSVDRWEPVVPPEGGPPSKGE